MTLKLHGSSIRKEFIYCDTCHTKFVWLNAYPLPDVEGYYVRCRKCRLQLG